MFHGPDTLPVAQPKGLDLSYGISSWDVGRPLWFNLLNA